VRSHHDVTVTDTFTGKVTTANVEGTAGCVSRLRGEGVQHLRHLSTSARDNQVRALVLKGQHMQAVRGITGGVGHRLVDQAKLGQPTRPCRLRAHRACTAPHPAGRSRNVCKNQPERDADTPHLTPAGFGNFLCSPLRQEVVVAFAGRRERSLPSVRAGGKRMDPDN
jgi:hypothetical protein